MKGQALWLMAIRQARLERVASSASGHERPAGKDMGPPPGLGRRLQRGIHATGLAEAGWSRERRAEM